MIWIRSGLLPSNGRQGAGALGGWGRDLSLPSIIIYSRRGAFCGPIDRPFPGCRFHPGGETAIGWAGPILPRKMECVVLSGAAQLSLRRIIVGSALSQTVSLVGGVQRCSPAENSETRLRPYIRTGFFRRTTRPPVSGQIGFGDSVVFGGLAIWGDAHKANLPISQEERDPPLYYSNHRQCPHSSRARAVLTTKAARCLAAGARGGGGPERGGIPRRRNPGTLSSWVSSMRQVTCHHVSPAKRRESSRVKKTPGGTPTPGGTGKTVRCHHQSGVTISLPALLFSITRTGPNRSSSTDNTPLGKSLSRSSPGDCAPSLIVAAVLEWPLVPTAISG